MNRRTLLASAGTLIAGAAAQTYARESAASLKDTVAEAERAFAGSMARRDLNAFASLVSPEAVFFGGADGNTPLRGRTAIVEGWKRFFEGPTAPFSWAPDSTEVLDSGTLAATSGPVRDATGTITGRFNSVWRLESDRRWRVVFDRGCAVCRP